jgi:hypothetical protein
MLYCRLLDLVEDHEVVKCRVEYKHQVSLKFECYFLLAAENCHLGTLTFAVCVVAVDDALGSVEGDGVLGLVLG